MPNSINPESLSPVMEPSDRQPEPGVALCFSGGGYRAMLFHLGVLWRLNEAAYLPKLQRISSVSGGSITAALLGLRWQQLGFQAGVATAFQPLIVEPLRAMAARTIDVTSVAKGTFLPGRISDKVAKAYQKHLYGDATLQDLPDDSPRFVINATNVQSGVLWRFSKPYMGDYRVGRILKPSYSLAAAVAASSAFPPFLSPAKLELNPDAFAPSRLEDLGESRYRRAVYLSDGGVYDNLGLETAWKRYQTLLVSDAGLAMKPDPKPETDWVQHTKRVLDLVDSQVRALRKRQLVGGFKAGIRQGAYWSIRSDVTNYGGSLLDCPAKRTEELATLATRLAETPPDLQERLINWGYAMTDTAVRRWVDPGLPPPQAFPHPRGV